MLTHSFFVVAEKVCYVGNGDTALEQDSRKRMPEPVRLWPFFELASQLKHLADFPTPHVRDSSNSKWMHTATISRACIQTFVIWSPDGTGKEADLNLLSLSINH
jgi:hypothetical protein